MQYHLLQPSSSSFSSASVYNNFTTFLQVIVIPKWVCLRHRYTYLRLSDNYTSCKMYMQQWEITSSTWLYAFLTSAGLVLAELVDDWMWQLSSSNITLSGTWKYLSCVNLYNKTSLLVITCNITQLTGLCKVIQLKKSKWLVHECQKHCTTQWDLSSNFNIAFVLLLIFL